MVVRLRLARHGTRNNPFYHLVAINDSKPRDARPIEKLGEYDPIPRPVPVRPAPRPMLHAGKGKEKEVPQVMTSGLASEMRLEKRIEWNSARIRHWLERGAQPSKPVARLLDRAGLIPPGKHYKGIYRPPPGAPGSGSSFGSSPNSSSSSEAGSGPGPVSALLSAAGAGAGDQPSTPAASARKQAEIAQTGVGSARTGEATIDQMA